MSFKSNKNVNEEEYHTWPENSEPHPVGNHHKDEVEEAAKRDYKDEYKKFQSSDKSKKYRAELNRYNRNKGTYGNGYGKEASHKGGKIAGFEKESVNRGRKEKSRLKKEQKINESQLLKLANNVIKTKHEEKGMSLVVAHHIINTYNSYKKSHPKLAKQVASLPVNKGIKFAKMIVGENKLREVIRKIIREDFAGSYPESKRKSFDGKRRKQSEVLGYKLTGKDDVKTEIDDATIKESAAGGLTYKKGKTITVTHKTSGKELVIIDKPNVRKEYEKIGYVAEGKLTEKPLKTNPKIWVSDKFDKVIDKLPYSKLTKNNVIKLAKKFKIDKDDALRWVSYNQDVDFGLKEGKLTEGGAQIAKTILKQLGGNKFIAMTGAKNLGHTNKGLQMKIGRNAKGVTHVIIDLDRGKDLYDIEFVKVRGTNRKTVKKLKGIYADQLGEIFKRYTGLNIRL